MRPHPRVPMSASAGAGCPGTGSRGCKACGQRLLREGSRRIQRLLERSPAVRRPGFKADPPGPRGHRRRARGFSRGPDGP